MRTGPVGARCSNSNDSRCHSHAHTFGAFLSVTAVHPFPLFATRPRRHTVEEGIRRYERHQPSRPDRLHSSVNLFQGMKSLSDGDSRFKRWMAAHPYENQSSEHCAVVLSAGPGGNPERSRQPGAKLACSAGILGFHLSTRLRFPCNSPLQQAHHVSDGRVKSQNHCRWNLFAVEPSVAKLANMISSGHIALFNRCVAARYQLESQCLFPFDQQETARQQDSKPAHIHHRAPSGRYKSMIDTSVRRSGYIWDFNVFYG